MSELSDTGFYILDESGERPVRCQDVETWAEWYEEFSHRRVAKTYFNDGRISVSTIFLGIDHGLDGRFPILWETMIFRSDNRALECRRCRGNREQALAMHAEMCALAEGLSLEPLSQWL